MSRRPTLQEILKQRQQGAFVGRQDHLATFQTHLTRPWDDPQRRFLLSYHGQGGVGKTTLLHRFRQLAQQATVATAWSDDAQTNLPALMAKIAIDLSNQGLPFKTFQEQYALYRTRQHEISADPNAPQGFAAFMTEKAAKIAVHAGRRLPVAGFLFDMVDEDTAAEQLSHWAAFVTKKLRNQHEADLVLQPVATLTPIFLQELYAAASDRSLILFFDTYERTAPYLDGWLRDLFNGRYGDLPITLTMVIAGRDPLNQDNWLPYTSILAQQPLAPFTESEARDFLARKAITNPTVVETILQLSGRFPLLLATLASESPQDPAQIGSASTTAVDRFLKWVPDPARRTAALHGALPQTLNRDHLALLVDATDAAPLFNWLKTMPFVQEKGESWVYHEVVRTQMLHHLRRESPQAWRDLHQTLANHFANQRDALNLEVGDGRRDPTWQNHELQFRYHQLCQAPQAHFPAALNRFLNALKANVDFAERWAATIHQALLDSNNMTLTDWSQALVSGLRAYREERYDETITLFTRILDYPHLEPHPQAIALTWRGQLYSFQGEFDNALADLDAAIDLYPTYAFAYTTRGKTYQTMRQNEKALADLDHAIDLDPSQEIAWQGRGQVHRLLRNFADSLASFNHLLTIDPNNSWALANRGVTYSWMGEKERALADLNRAIELKPDYAWAWSNRGEVHSQAREFDKALANIERAIALSPENASYIARRGMLYRRQEKYSEALADFKLAIALNPDYVFARAQRGDLYKRTDRFKQAIADLSHAIDIEPTLFWAYTIRAAALREIGQVSNALADLDTALKIDPESVQAHIELGLTHKQAGHLDKALTAFSNALEIQPERVWALAERGIIYWLQQQYKAAYADFDKIPTLVPEFSWGYFGRGLMKKKLNWDNPRSDLKTAVTLAENKYETHPHHWQNTFHLALYKMAAGRSQQAEAIYRYAVNNGVTSYRIAMGISDLNDFLVLFPDNEDALTLRNMLRNSLNDHISPE